MRPKQKIINQSESLPVAIPAGLIGFEVFFLFFLKKKNSGRLQLSDFLCLSTHVASSLFDPV